MSHAFAAFVDLIERVFLRHECMRCKVATLHRRPLGAERSIVPLDADVNRFDTAGSGLLQRRGKRHFRRTPGSWKLSDLSKSQPRVHR
jgi:hypothetical protein